MPSVGFVWYSPTDRVDGDFALRLQAGNVDSVELDDGDRKIRAADTAYKQLIACWRDVLPTQSQVLPEPVAMPISRLMRVSSH